MKVYEIKKEIPPEIAPLVHEKIEEFRTIYAQLKEEKVNFNYLYQYLKSCVDTLFPLISSVVEVPEGDNSYNVETMGTSQDTLLTTYSEESLDRTNQGYLLNGEKKQAIIQQFKTVGPRLGLNANEANEILNTSHSPLSVDQVEFIKKVHLIVEYCQTYDTKQNANSQSNSAALASCLTNVERAKGGRLSTFNTIAIGNTTMSSIAERYIQDVVNKNKSIQPVDDNTPADFTIVCGLPGSGKSSVFVDDKLNQGYLPIDLDNLVTDYIMPSLGVPFSDDLYKIAVPLSQLVQKIAIERHYNILLEKIGHSKAQIVSISDGFSDIVSEVEQEHENKKLPYTHSLCMTNSSSETSTHNNYIRYMEQLLKNSKLRGYDFEDLIKNNESTTYAYFDLISDPEASARFDSICIGDRSRGIYQGMSIVSGMTIEQANLLANQSTRDRSDDSVADFTC